MNISRRDFVLGASASACLISSGSGMLGSAFAQSAWAPTRDVELVIPFAAGGGSDLLARVVGKIIVEEKLIPQPLVLNNRPGGGGAVGLGYVAASRRKDPNTIVLINGTTQITPILNPSARTLTEIQPIMNFMLDDFLLFVRGDSKYKTAQEMVEDIKSKPTKTFNFSTGGTTDVMAITVLSRALGKDINPVNFNSGGESLTALLGGHVDGTIGNPLEFMGQLASGKVRALGVFRDTRFSAMPDVPTMKEIGLSVPNFQMWRGIAVPKDVDPAAQAYWEGIMQKVAASPTMKKYIADNVATEAPIVGADFVAFLAAQEKLYRELLAKPA
ncbi:Bug family tripartite tricarboxylate transporter substrate binding protein [Ancylobacter sp. G4_0304]|uniref:Bug family tripartite tricarboxylate transporter substrate binding protein n=1 Tax=Ancylobacter sp. G4_0304 TaxID=3114289 RepID=UPI0039C67AE2